TVEVITTAQATIPQGMGIALALMAALVALAILGPAVD
ncbi:hypothetical protein BN1044_00282, partial [Hafnia alvei]